MPLPRAIGSLRGHSGEHRKQRPVSSCNLYRAKDFISSALQQRCVRTARQPSMLHFFKEQLLSLELHVVMYLAKAAQPQATSLAPSLQGVGARSLNQLSEARARSSQHRLSSSPNSSPSNGNGFALCPHRVPVSLYSSRQREDGPLASPADRISSSGLDQLHTITSATAAKLHISSRGGPTRVSIFEGLSGWLSHAPTPVRSTTAPDQVQ
ncbi:hypothetical protein QBC40DRAFT_313554 [Triangularia verruculosa]|uniref:Uncharacterized protein n=1 Tax=Triangularia verruculosa TaxID=2587418 RepID=A0AAN7AWL5_9PEZI|nr:hypothetical protein QBC40DRAFT_313554 [Triangularia verruculosa]